MFDHACQPPKIGQRIASRSKTKKGFTLIELLVVIAIIGILSAMGLTALNGAREKARDAKRMNDLAQLRTALALYAEDNNGHYPPLNDPPAQNKSEQIVAGTFIYDRLVPNYISSIPTAPVATDAGSAGAELRCTLGSDYWYTADQRDGPDPATKFAVWTRLEGTHCDYLYILNSGNFAGRHDDRPNSSGNRKWDQVDCGLPTPGSTDVTLVCDAPTDIDS